MRRRLIKQEGTEASERITRTTQETPRYQKSPTKRRGKTRQGLILHQLQPTFIIIIIIILLEKCDYLVLTVNDSNVKLNGYG